MDPDEGRYPDGYAPGDLVTVIDGTFAGMPGAVVGPEAARLLYRRSGGENSLVPCPPGQVWVVLSIFGRTVPILFLSSQIEHRPV